MQKKLVDSVRSSPVPLKLKTHLRIPDLLTTTGRNLDIDPVNLPIRRIFIGGTVKIQENVSEEHRENKKIIDALKDIKTKVRNWEKFVPILKQYLTTLCDKFKVGNISVSQSGKI